MTRFFTTLLVIFAFAYVANAQEGNFLSAKSGHQVTVKSIKRIDADQIEVTRSSDGKVITVAISVLTEGSQKFVNKVAPWKEPLKVDEKLAGTALKTGAKAEDISFKDWRSHNEKIWPHLHQKLQPNPSPNPEVGAFAVPYYVKAWNNGKGVLILHVTDEIKRKIAPTWTIAHGGENILFQDVPYDPRHYNDRFAFSWAEMRILAEYRFTEVYYDNTIVVVEYLVDVQNEASGLVLVKADGTEWKLGKSELVRHQATGR